MSSRTEKTNIENKTQDEVSAVIGPTTEEDTRKNEESIKEIEKMQVESIESKILKLENLCKHKLNLSIPKEINDLISDLCRHEIKKLNAISFILKLYNKNVTLEEEIDLLKQPRQSKISEAGKDNQPENVSKECSSEIQNIPDPLKMNEQKLVILKNDLNEKSNLIKELQQDNHNLNEQIKNLGSKSSEAISIGVLGKENRDEDRKALQNKIEICEKTIKDQEKLLMSLGSVEKQNKILKEQVAQFEKQKESSSVAELKSQIVSLLKNNKELRDEIEILQNKCQSLKEEQSIEKNILKANEVLEDKNSKDEEISNLQSEIYKYVNTVADLKTKLEEFKKQNIKIKDQLIIYETKEKFNNEDEKNYKDQIEKLKLKNKELEEKTNIHENEQFQQNVSEILTQQEDNLRVENSQLKEQINDLNVKFMEYDFLQEESSNQIDNLLKENKQYKEKETFAKKLEADFNEQASQLNSARQALGVSDPYANLVVLIKKSLAEKDSFSQLYSDELALSENLKEEIEIKKNELISATAARKGLELKYLELSRENESLQARLSETSKTMEEAQQRISELDLKKESTYSQKELENRILVVKSDVRSHYERAIETIKKKFEQEQEDWNTSWQIRCAEVEMEKEIEKEAKIKTITCEWNEERKELERLTNAAAEAFKKGTDSVDLLKKQVVDQRTVIEFLKHNQEVLLRRLK